MGLKTDKFLLKDILLIAALVIFFTAMAFVLEQPGIRSIVFDIDTLRFLLQGGDAAPNRLFSALAFLLAGGAVIAIGVPRLWISAAGGIIYGAFMGTLLSVLASLIGASVLYLAGKTILSHIAQRRLGDTMKIWQGRFQDNAFWWVLYGRLFPFSNSTLMNLLCGSCLVPFTQFMLGSLVGFIPLAVVFATFGSGGIKGNLFQIALASALLIISVFSRRLLKGASGAEHNPH